MRAAKFVPRKNWVVTGSVSIVCCWLHSLSKIYFFLDIILFLFCLLVCLFLSLMMMMMMMMMMMCIEWSDNTCDQFSLFSSNAWLLSHDMQPNVRTNLLTNFRTWIALTGKMLGKISSGKAVLCSSTFSYLFVLVRRIKMRVWVLFRLQIDHRSVVKRTSFQPICSLHEMTRLWIFDKNFFFQILSF